jgi:FkbM family methyltransferase
LRPSRIIAGRRFFFDPATDIGLTLWRTGSFESETIAHCAARIRPESTVIDVGANIGLHTVHFAQAAALGKVICFEPARATFAQLLRNVAGLSNVIPLNMALSDRVGLQEFFVASDNAYSGLKDTRRKSVLYREWVPCFTGDAILEPLTRTTHVDLIKIDVEGFERQVLEGLRTLISAHRPVICCEIFGGQDSNPDPVGTVEYCVALGYEAFVIKGDQLVAAAAHDDALYTYLFLPRGAPARL